MSFLLWLERRAYSLVTRFHQPEGFSVHIKQHFQHWLAFVGRMDGGAARPEKSLKRGRSRNYLIKSRNIQKERPIILMSVTRHYAPTREWPCPWSGHARSVLIDRAGLSYDPSIRRARPVT